MTVSELLAVLVGNPGVKMHFMLPDNSFVPAHYHITEVGRVQKDFIDCGGTVRSLSSCVLQVWVANDLDHRLETTKLAKIIEIARPLLKSDELPVEVEYEDAVVSQYPRGGAEVTPSGILFTVGTKHTACLAPEKCGVGGEACCSVPEPKRILFVCIHNSARSQMAEAFVNQMCQGAYEAHSAGLEPGVLNPLVVEAMQEVGINIAGARRRAWRRCLPMARGSRVSSRSATRPAPNAARPFRAACTATIGDSPILQPSRARTRSGSSRSGGSGTTSVSGSASGAGWLARRPDKDQAVLLRPCFAS